MVRVGEVRQLSLYCVVMQLNDKVKSTLAVTLLS